MRTDTLQKSHLEEALSQPTAAQREQKAKEYGIHLVRNGLHGFAESDKWQGSSTQVFGVETMHVMDLGVGLYIVDHAAAYLERVGKKSKVAELNARIKEVSKESRAEDSAVPSCENYFSAYSRVQAREHRNMFQIMPHLFNGIDKDLCELACL